MCWQKDPDYFYFTGLIVAMLIQILHLNANL